MPVGPVCNVNIAIRPVGIGDVVDLHMCRKHIDDDPIIQRHDARAELFASNKLTMRRIHGEKVAFHANEIAFVTLHRADKMTLRVTLEKLSMNDVNVFAGVKDHTLLELIFALVAREGLHFSCRNYFDEVIRRVQLPDFRNSRIFLCSSGVRLARTRICIMATSHWAGLNEPGDLML